MKSRKVGVNKHKKHNDTKRKRASKIVKSKKNKLHKRKRRTRRRSRRQRGGNADFVVVVIGTHGCHRTISDGVMDQQRVPPGMNIRKINAAPLGLENMTTYNNNHYDADTELVESTVQEVLNECKDNCDLSSASYDLASKLKKTDRYTQDRDILEDSFKGNENQKRIVNRLSDIHMDELYGTNHDKEEIQKKLDNSINLYKNFMNKTDQRYQIEVINDEHPTYFDKKYSKVGDKDIMLFEENKKVANITHDVVGRLTRGWYIYTSEIYDYLASIGKYNVIIVDLSCSVLDYKDGFTDRDIRHLNYDMKQKRKLLPNPYKKEWQIKRKRGEFNRDDLDSHLNESMV